MTDFEKNIQYEPNSGCWLWEGNALPAGYGQIHRDGKTILAHRFSYELHVGPIPSGMHVCHSCDNPSCVNPDHLWLGTHQDNMDDMAKKGRRRSNTPKGEKHFQGKLTNNQILEIRADKRPSRVIASDYNVSHTMILRVKRRTCWGHVND